MGDFVDFVHSQPQFRKNRIPSLYSDFRSLRATNPDGFASNVTAWKKVLCEATKKVSNGNTDTLVLHTGEDLLNSLCTRNYSRPLALGTVVNEAINSKEFIPLDQFLNQKESIYASYWINPWAILGWGLERVGLKSSGVTDERVPAGKFVLIPNVASLAKEVLHHICSRTGNFCRVFSLELFRRELTNFGASNQKGISDRDLSVVLTYLSRDVNEAVYNGKVVKFKDTEGILLPITEQDTTIAQLKEMVEALQLNVESLGARVNNLEEKARKALESKNRILAMAALRSKQVTERHLASRAQSLGQLEEVLLQIEHAASNVELVRQMERSSKVLRNLNKEVGGVERVDAIMSSLKEEMEEAAEVVCKIGEATPPVDEEEVEDELETMLREEMEKKEMQKDIEIIARFRTPEKPEDIAESLSSSVDQLNLSAAYDPTETTENINAEEQKEQMASVAN
ncbi:hypothetical protein RUND412_011174 [Rhizina undulata]